MRRICVAMLLALLSVTGAFAQKLTGALTVQVLDPEGKAVANVAANLENSDRAIARQVTTSSDGLVNIQDLPPGDYKLTLKHDGFRTVTTVATIRVGITTSLELKMEIGAASSSVLVEASAITVDTDRSTVQGVVQSQQIDALPLNGRNFLDLAQLAPGVQVVDGGTFDPTKNQFTGVSVGGRTGRSTRIQVDGVDITDETVGTTVMNISNESIQEFGIAQSSLDPSTDLTSSGAVNIISKSGTNSFHGSGFGFWRRSDFAANNGALSVEDPDKPPFSRDNYGGRFGGPLLKDKLFFFTSYERQKQVGAIVANVPANPALPNGFTGFSGAFGAPEDEHLGSARLDYNLTSNHHFFYKYTHDDNFGVTGFGGVGFSAFANKNSSNAHVVGWDYAKGAFTHGIRFSFLKFVNGIVDANAAAGTPQPPDAVQINITGLGGFVYGPNANAPQATYQQNRQLKYDGSWSHGKHTVQYGIAYNRIDEAGFASFFGLGPRLRASFSAGLATDPFNANGSSDPLNYKFNSAFIGNGLGFGSEKPVLGLPFGGFVNNRLGVYLHDTWKATRTLTFNGGLRYDLDTGLSNHDLPRAQAICGFSQQLCQTPRNDNFRLAPQVGFAWNVGGDGKTVIRGGGGIYYETNIFNNLLFDRTVNLPPGLGNATPLVGVGGSSFLISPIDGSSIFNPSTDCIGAQPTTATPNSCIGASIGAAIPFIVAAENEYKAQSAQLAANWPVPGSVPQFNIDKGVVSGAILDPDYKSPYGAQLNVGLQRRIRSGLVLTLDYIMNRGVHFNTQVDRNRTGAANTLNLGLANGAISRTLGDFGCIDIDCVIANGGTIDDFANEGLSGGGPAFDGFAFGGNNPNFRQMNVLEPVGVSRYQALQAQLTGQLGSWGAFKHTIVNASYALSRFSSSAVDQDFLSLAVNNDQPTQYYGPAAQDRLHNLGVSIVTELPFHFQLATTSYFRSSGASNPALPANGTLADIFTSDLNGDGTVGDPLPGANRGSFGRSFGVNGLNQLITKYNNTIAGTLTPAGQALVDSGLFSQDQLVALGAVAQTADLAPAGEKANPLFYTTDIRLSWNYKIKERLTIQPIVDCFNVFNKTNTAGPLSGILSTAPGTINGTTAYFTRVGAGSGSFSSGQPRAFQFGIRVSF